MDGRRLTLRQLWLMAEGRRQQMRFAMLPHIGGKYAVENFLKRGVVNQYKCHPIPSTPAIEKAKADLEEERRMHERRQHGQE